MEKRGIYSWTSLLWISSFLALSSSQREQIVEEYCERQTFSPSCADNEVLLMTHAQYGRMRAGGCISLQGRPCSLDVLSLLDARCSGRVSCEVPVANLVPEHLQPCPKDYRSYLEASYSCVQVVVAPEEFCSQTGAVEIRQQSGYLSSLVTGQTNCGSYDNPWWISALPGQRIRITLLDFEQVTSTNPTTCHVYAVINEEGTGVRETVCASMVRQSVVYTSVSSQVRVRIVPKRQQGNRQLHFLLKFESVGCAGLPAPANGWSRKIGQEVTMGCNNTGSDIRWRLTCEAGVWRGQYSNCSAVGTSTGRSDDGLGTFRGAQGLSILIILAIAAMVGLLILAFGLVYVRRKRHGPVREPVITQPDYAPTHYEHQAGIAKSSTDQLDSYQSTENNYYRTWQLQRHGHMVHQKLPVTQTNVTPDPNRTGTGSPTDADTRSRYSDHIYESPSFERKEFAPCVPYKPEGVPIEYYELDPDSPTGNPNKPGKLQ